jgi:DNA-binding Xre family transcriptional regulator
MIRFRLKELLAQKEFSERKVISLTEVANVTGINRMTLSRIANHPGTNTGTENINKLCGYFNCEVGQLMEYLPDEYK